MCVCVCVCVCNGEWIITLHYQLLYVPKKLLKCCIYRWQCPWGSQHSTFLSTDSLYQIYWTHNVELQKCSDWWCQHKFHFRSLQEIVVTVFQLLKHSNVRVFMTGSKKQKMVSVLLGMLFKLKLKEICHIFHIVCKTDGWKWY